jgi:hypothetical protein
MLHFERKPGARGVRADRPSPLLVSDETSDPIVDALVFDLLEWLREVPRPYSDVMEAWTTSCPRLPVWETANRLGLIRRISTPGFGTAIAISREGRQFIRAYGSRNL